MDNPKYVRKNKFLHITENIQEVMANNNISKNQNKYEAINIPNNDIATIFVAKSHALDT